MNVQILFNFLRSFELNSTTRPRRRLNTRPNLLFWTRRRLLCRPRRVCLSPRLQAGPLRGFPCLWVSLSFCHACREVSDVNYSSGIKLLFQANRCIFKGKKVTECLHSEGVLFSLLCIHLVESGRNDNGTDSSSVMCLPCTSISDILMEDVAEIFLLWVPAVSGGHWPRTIGVLTWPHTVCDPGNWKSRDWRPPTTPAIAEGIQEVAHLTCPLGRDSHIGRQLPSSTTFWICGIRATPQYPSTDNNEMCPYRKKKGPNILSRLFVSALLPMAVNKTPFSCQCFVFFHSRIS